MKSVRFDCSLNKIGYTYSATEYDRSHFVIPPSPNRMFDLSLISPSSSPTSSPTSPSPPASPSSPPSLSSSPSSLTFPPSSLTTASCNRRPYIAPLDFSSIPKQSNNDHIQQKGSKPPKLMINTEMTSGPLFFTHLSTHYQCRLEDEYDDGNNPMMMMKMNRLKNLNPSSLESY